MSDFVRADGRRADQLRPLRFQNGIAPHATGSTLVSWGNTQVICGVTIDEAVPKWMQSQKVSGGWITAEYSMLPYSTLDRKARDISKLKLDGRSQEIQRLIGRSLRAAVDLEALGARTIWIDCDVLQADGGTRTASITGAYVAAHDAVSRLIAEGKLTESPLLASVAAISVGILDGTPLLDLEYTEDSACDTDMNVVMTGVGHFVEVQGTAEGKAFSRAEMNALLALAEKGIGELMLAQQQSLAG